MMLLFCAKHILHNNLPVSVYLRDLSVAVGRHVVPQPLTDYKKMQCHVCFRTKCSYEWMGEDSRSWTWLR